MLRYHHHTENDHTLRQHPNCLAEVTRLAVCAMSVLEHTYDKTQLAEQTMFSGAVCSDVGFRKPSDGRAVMHNLQDRICVGVEDMCFQPAVFGLVVKPNVKNVCCQYQWKGG